MNPVFENRGFLAVDTEFVWNRTYYARLGLVQFGPGAGFDAGRLPAGRPACFDAPRTGAEEEHAVLVDPLHAPAAMVRAVLEDEGVVKVFHDALQDAHHLSRWTGAAIRGVFDTRLAAGFCGLPSTLSLGRLVEETTGRVLPKSETLTNWMQRPLTSQQLLYAAQDVVFLEAVVAELLHRAKEFGTDAWMREEMAAAYTAERLAPPTPEQIVAKAGLPLSCRRDPRAAARYRALALWRERTALERDLPRKWIAPDDTLALCALKPDTDPLSFTKKELSPAFARSFGFALRESCRLAPEPPQPHGPHLTPQERDEIKDKATALLQEIARRAEPLHVDPALFANRASATDFVANPDNPAHPLRNGWRKEALGEL